jgi:hypothetical protein
MTWIVVVMLVCSGDSCRIESAEASVVAPDFGANLHKKCDAAPNCLEPRRGIYLIRQTVAAPKPRPEPVPALGSSKV